MATHDVHALGFGRVRSTVTLGQPLSIAVPLSLDESESFQPDCVRAEVLHGDAMWPGNAVRARVTQGPTDASRVVRITSSTVVEEPVLIVTVHVGCPTQFSRSFTLLGDPPLALPSTAAGDRPQAEDVAAGSSSVARAVGRGDNPGARGSQRTDRGVRDARAATTQARVGATVPRRSAPRADGERTRLAALRTPPGVLVPMDGGAQGASAPKTAAADGRSDSAGPRLRLDVGSASVPGASGKEPSAEAVAAANVSAQAAERAASAAQARLLMLEAEIAKLRADSKAQLDVMLKLQSQIAQRQEPSPWLLALAALALAAVVTSIGLALRLRQAQSLRRRDAWWKRDSRDLTADEVRPDPAAVVDAQTPAQPSAPLTANATTVGPATMVHPRHGFVVGGAGKPLSNAASAQEEAQRAVSVDEQIDLEQEADFFIALGHDDAAIDLLLAHLRSTGGSAPMPYLKLLELYRRRGERDDYELMRRRFNQRFNSVAPEWDHDAHAGRVLEDYAHHVLKLQVAWSRPIDAIAVLEAMAFGRVEGDELFDLPAYQDVLFLYQLARKLHDEGGSGAGLDVDVLLPLDDAASAAALPPATALRAPSSTPGASTPSSAVLDLDISTGVGSLTPYRGDARGPLPKIELDLPLELTQPPDAR